MVSDLVRGNQLLRSGRLEEAVDAFQKAIALHPHFHWSHYKLGEALEQLGRLEEAIAAYRKAIAIKPNNDYKYYEQIGKALEQKGEWQEAISNYKKAMEINSNLPRLHSNLASLLEVRQNAKDLAKTEQAIKQSQKMDYLFDYFSVDKHTGIENLKVKFVEYAKSQDFNISKVYKTIGFHFQKKYMFDYAFKAMRGHFLLNKKRPVKSCYVAIFYSALKSGRFFWLNSFLRRNLVFLYNCDGIDKNLADCLSLVFDDKCKSLLDTVNQIKLVAQGQKSYQFYSFLIFSVFHNIESGFYQKSLSKSERDELCQLIFSRELILTPIDMYGIKFSLELDCVRYSSDERLYNILSVMDRRVLSYNYLLHKMIDYPKFYDVALILKNILLHNNDINAPAYFWKKLKFFYTCFADFKMYHFCRKKYEDSLVTNSGEYYNSCLERGIDIPPTAVSNSNWQIHHRLLSGFKNDAQQLYQEKLMIDNVSNDFCEFVKGKSVAVVGPADSNIDQGDEIDSFDVVYGLNTNFEEKSESFLRKYGKRTDVAWFNGFSSWMVNQGKIDIRRLKYAITKKKVGVPNARLAFANWNMLFTAYPNGLQYVLYDLLLFSPSRVKIFYCNFYASEKMYNDSYWNFNTKNRNINSYLPQETWRYNYGFLGHDLISNFRLVKRFYQMEYIEVDEVAKPILEMSDSEYVDKMQQLYPSLYYQKKELLF
ncbi:tetratricopeptide repeat protein [Arthrospira platensis BEA 1257B]